MAGSALQILLVMDLGPFENPGENSRIAARKGSTRRIQPALDRSTTVRRGRRAGEERLGYLENASLCRLYACRRGFLNGWVLDIANGALGVAQGLDNLEAGYVACDRGLTGL